MLPVRRLDRRLTGKRALQDAQMRAVGAEAGLDALLAQVEVEPPSEDSLGVVLLPGKQQRPERRTVPAEFRHGVVEVVPDHFRASRRQRLQPLIHPLGDERQLRC